MTLDLTFAQTLTNRQILEETEPPSIPYIGLILQDLTFLHVGNKDMLADDVSVNFDKRWQIFNILDQLRKFRHRYRLLLVQIVQSQTNSLRLFNRIASN